jgi:hypothetical protein
MEKNLNKLVLEIINEAVENINYSPISDFSEKSPRSPGVLTLKRNIPALNLKVPKYNPKKDDIPPEDNVKFKYDPEEGLLFHELRTTNQKF